MKLNKTSFFRNTAASVVGFVAFALPTLALADDGSSGGGGMALLIPRPAEFIPACIAFVIIWIVLAKFAWPSVVKAMDARENKIKSDLDDAAKSKADAAKSAKEAKRAIDEANHKADEIVAEAKSRLRLSVLRSWPKRRRMLRLRSPRLTMLWNLSVTKRWSIFQTPSSICLSRSPARLSETA